MATLAWLRMRNYPHRMSTATPWWRYVQRVSGHAVPAQVARDTKLDKSAPTRWSNGGGVEAAQAVRVARAYNANVLEALAAAGFIDRDEIKLTTVERPLTELDETALLRELLRRAERRQAGTRRSA